MNGEEMEYILSPKEYEQLAKEYNKRISTSLEGYERFVEAYSEYFMKQGVFSLFFKTKTKLDFAIDNDMLSDFFDYETIEESMYPLPYGSFKEVHLNKEEYKELIGDENANKSN